MKTLISGPWVGEVGWELFAWNGYVRALSRNYDKTIIIARPSSKHLYEDFCTQFISFEPVGGLADSFFMHDHNILESAKRCIIENNIKLDKNTSLFLPKRIGVPPHPHYEQGVVLGSGVVKPEYKSFGTLGETEGYDFIFHIRDRALRKEDNWCMENWQELRRLLGTDKSIACIGTKRESACLPDTADLRGIEMSSLVNILKNSGAAFGPSSGPMHLASLCELPHVVWSIPDNKARYEENWNPLRTRVLFTSEYDWHPSPGHIYKIFMEWI